MENRVLISLHVTGAERDAILRVFENRERRYHFPIKVSSEGGDSFNCKELTMYDLKVNRKVQVTVGTPVDELGNVAKIDGQPVFEALNPEIAVFEEQGADGLSGWINPVRSRSVDADPAMNVASFKVKVDADLSSGVRHIEEVFSVNVVSGEAVDVLGVGFGTEAPNAPIVVPPPPPPVPVAPTFTSSPFPATGTVGAAEAHVFAAEGDAPVTFAVTAGALPDGLTLDPSGAVSGTYAAAGTFSAEVTASNAAGTAVQSVASVVAEEEPPAPPA